MCISDIGIIELEEMRFWAHHGCLDIEKEEGNLFIVDFRGELDMKAAIAEDKLSNTVNYAEVYDVIQKEMETPVNLLEYLAGRIVNGIAKQCPQFVSFSVRVSKRNPPVNGPVAWSRVTLNYKK